MEVDDGDATDEKIAKRKKQAASYEEDDKNNDSDSDGEDVPLLLCFRFFSLVVTAPSFFRNQPKRRPLLIKVPLIRTLNPMMTSRRRPKPRQMLPGTLTLKLRRWRSKKPQNPQRPPLQRRPRRKLKRPRNPPLMIASLG